MHIKTLVLSLILASFAHLSLSCQEDEHDHTAGPAVDVPPRLDGGAEAGTPTVQATKGRLLVADGDPENPRVLIVDLDDGTIVGRYPTLGTARAYSTEAGAGYAYAVQAVPGLVEIFSSGIGTTAGGGLTKLPPHPIDTRLEGARPTHWVSHDHWVVSFNDGDGSFDYLLESSLGGPRVLKRRATTGIAHHGVAVITHGNVIASHAIPDPTDATRTVRTGVTVRKLAAPDAVVETVPGCSGLHGEAANDRWVGFGCSDGILLGERTNGKLTFRKLSNPSGTPIGTLRARDGLSVLVANNRDMARGYDVGFVLVDPQSASWTPIDIGVRQLAFLLEAPGGRLVTLGDDGQVRLHDAMTGVPIGPPLPAVEPHVTGTAPGLALGAGVAFVIDARVGTVTEVDLSRSQPNRVFNVGGQPVSAAAFGRAQATAR